MKKVFLLSICAMILTVSCQKEGVNQTNPVTKAQGVVTTSTIKGVTMLKDGNPYPNMATSSSLGFDEIGWFLDLGAVQSGYSAPKGPVASNLGDASLYCGGINTVNLYAGQNILMGTVSYANDADNLYITYSTYPDWYMTEVHLYVGTLAGTPKSGGGTPSPGRFPIKSTFTASTLSQDVTYTIPVSSLPGSGNFIVAAHASVIRADIDGDVVAKETAWASGTRFQSNKNWATYISGSLQSCEPIITGDITKGNTTNK